jgi:hypothetical protein
MSNLGAYVIKSVWQGKLDSVNVVLLDADKLVETARQLRAAGITREDGLYRALEASIVGVLEAGGIDEEKGSCEGAWAVQRVAGPGYGDVLYALGLGLSQSGLLAPDRSQVSSKAAKVWARIAASGRQAVSLNPRTCQTYREAPLNFAFRATAADKALARKLTSAGLTAMSRARVVLEVSPRDAQYIAVETAWNVWERFRPEEFLVGAWRDGRFGG